VGIARLRWWLVLAGIAIPAIAAAIIARTSVADLIVRARTHLALEQLLDVLPAENLSVARFSAFPHERVRSSMRGAALVSPQVDARAAKLLSISADSSSPDAIAASAAAWVIRREFPTAVARLEKAVLHTPHEARLWSDLAAAYFETNQPLRALVAADKALRIDPRSSLALDNRALILGRLGLEPVVNETWPSERSRWRTLEKELLAAVAAGDDATVARIVGECPRMSRVSAEGPYLARWAEAAGRDAATAEEWLRVARTIGSVVRLRGDSLLAETVAAIDGADSEARGRLARAHVVYDRGRRALSMRDHAVAQRELREAADLFRAAHSPMELVARAYSGSSLLEVARSDEAARILAGVLDVARAKSGHRALTAHAEQLLALCEVQRGAWNAAAESARHSAALFHDLGETASAATSESTLAAILDLAGQRERGWEVRLRGFESTSADGSLDRLLVAVGSATRAAMRAQDRDLALSFLDIEGSLAARIRDPLVSADFWTRRALLQHDRRDFEDRDTSMGRARAAISAVVNENERARLAIELGAAEAVFVRHTEPARAVELLGRAVRFCEETNRRLPLPALLLQRGRTFLAAGNLELAWQDFSTAIDELEKKRGAISDLKLRARLLDTAEELFDEAIALQVRAGNAEEAFRLAERARGRELLDALGGEAQPVTSSAAVARLLSPETLLIEYAVLPDQLVIFTIRRDGMRMHRVPVSRAVLRARPDALLGSVSDEIATAKRLIIVPHGILQRVAFGALRWNGQFLVQTHVIAETPSASRLAAAAKAAEAKQKSVLIVGNPAPDPERNLDPLPRVRREITDLRAIHPRSRVLFGVEATKQRFTAIASQYDVIHFAGHGLSDEQSISAQLLFHEGPLLTAEIARLGLTRNPLVVLSACGTLRGRTAGMEGMPSLARSFLEAGASAVVATLDDIDDEQAAQLVTSLHRHIAAGAHPADALRDAQREAIARGGEAADPKNWAPFVLYSAAP